MATRLDLTPSKAGQDGVNTTAERPKADRNKDRHRPGYMREYMREWRANRRRTQGAG